MKKILFALVLLSLLSTPSALASGFFIGVGAGQTSLEVPGTNARFDLDDTGYKGFAGYRFGKYFGVEIAYTDLGDFEETIEDESIAASASLGVAYAVGVLPLSPRLDLFGKLGYSFWDTSIVRTVGTDVTTTDADGNDVAYGFGIGYRLTQKFGLRLEWETFDVDSADSVKFISLGAHWGF